MNKRTKSWCQRNMIDCRVYDAWIQMRDRCRNPNHKHWHRYGGRGITICTRWDDFKCFAADMGPHPGKGYSLDRSNNNGNYDKSNCWWSNAKHQGRNKCTTKLTPSMVAIIRDGRHMQADLARQWGISSAQISRVVNYLNWR